MHWALKAARELVESHPETDIFVLASGISPSGDVHIGNFREVVTTYFVTRALQFLGKKTRFILSWDDYDRFRKVPAGLPDHYSQYIGMPYSEVPDPTGQYESYAAYYEHHFEETLNRLGIHPEYIYQHKAYQSGEYNEMIQYALAHRETIQEIINAQKTSKDSQDQYPINIYCRRCLKDDTRVDSYDPVRGTLEYTCACGHHEFTEISSFNRMKLVWKVDWPMRWQHEGVIFEPGGRDHSSAGGSFEVSTQIAKTIFNYQAPHYIAYDFIGIKGQNGKMSSSLGNLITPDELLRIYPPEVILYMFAKFSPDHGFDIGLDESVIREYAEFERTIKNYETLDETSQFAIYLATRHLGTIETNYHFSQIAGIFPLLNFDYQQLHKLLSPISQAEEIVLVDMATKVKYWIQEYMPERRISINTRVPNALNAVHHYEWFDKLEKLVMRTEDFQSNAFVEALYDIPLNHDESARKRLQKEFFKTLYMLIINQNHGPKLPVLFDIVGKDHLLHLLVQLKTVIR